MLCFVTSWVDFKEKDPNQFVKSEGRKISTTDSVFPESGTWFEPVPLQSNVLPLYTQIIQQTRCLLKIV